MLKSNQTTEFFDILAKVLLRCTVLGFLLLMFWFGAVMLAGDLVYAVHGAMFGLGPHELQTIHYCGMGLVKLLIGCFFLIPWISIRLVLSKHADR